MTTDAIRSHMPEADPVHSPPDRRDRRWWYLAGVLLVAAVVILVLALTGDDTDRGTDTVTPTAPSAGPGVQPSAEPEPPPVVVDRSTAVWPTAGGNARLDDPVEAARRFAVDYLGFEAPVVGDFQQGDSRSGEVAIRPIATGPVTTVLVRQLSGEDTWSVLGASTGNIRVTAPEALAAISSPVTVRGSAWTFEGNVVVQVRQDGTNEPVGQGYVTGGGDQLREFTGSIAFSDPSQKYGAVVFSDYSAKDGSLWQASVVRVQLTSGGTAAPAACKVPAGEKAGAGEMAVSVFYTCDPDAEAVPAPQAVSRVVPASSGVLRASLTALLAGPTAGEKAAGMTSFFSSATKGMLRDVTLTSGHAVVDFGDLPSVIPNASTSAGSSLLLSELDATVFQFGTVTSAEYRLEGSCTAFNEWLQGGGCEARTR